MVVNIELKAPSHPDFKPRYDCDKAAKVVLDMMNRFEMARQVMISSFQPEIIEAIQRETMGLR